MNGNSPTVSVARAALALIALSLSNIVSAQGKEVAPTATILQLPEEPGETAAAVGGTIAAKATIYTYRGIELTTPIEAQQRGGSGAGRPSVIIQPQFLVARGEDSKWVYYSGNVIYKQAGVTNMTGELGAGGLQNRVGGLRFSKEDPSEYEIWVRQHRGRGFYIDEPIDYREATIGAGDDLSEAVELVYGGREGDTLTIIYREHAGSAPEPVVNESLALSLSAGPAFDVRGARFEVIEATADQLRYRVLQHFE